MKYAKILGLLAVAAAAVMAFAGTASATITSPAGTAYSGTIEASSTHTELTGSVNITCAKSTVKGKVETNHAKHASGKVSSLTFTECGNHTVEVKKAGELTVTSSGVAGSNSGTLYSTGAEVTILTHSFFLGTTHCVYVTNNTHIGTVTGGTEAKLAIASAPISQSPTDGLCGDDAKWDGSYTATNPHELTID